MIIEDSYRHRSFVAILRKPEHACLGLEASDRFGPWIETNLDQQLLDVVLELTEVGVGLRDAQSASVADPQDTEGNIHHVPTLVPA